MGAGTTRRSEPITLEALEAAWNAFIEAHPDQQILTSAMRNALPAPAAEGGYRLMVGTPPQKTAFDTAMPTLTTFMRDRLRNDDFTLAVDIDPTLDKEATLLPPQEFLRKAVEANPSLGSLLSALDAEMA